MCSRLIAGAASVEITPQDRQFLCGYPHIERYSIGVNDPLLSSALYVNDGAYSAMFIANDVIYVSKDSATRIRERISERTGISTKNIMISATHTHSGPITTNPVSGEYDKIVPAADRDYIRFMEDRIVTAGIKSCQNSVAVKIGLGIANSNGIGTNRRKPDGPADHNVPVLLVQDASTKKMVACMLVCSMHPTVLHEDSKLISADFLGYSRIYLQKNVFSSDCVILHHTGPSGNQSPRHVARSNTCAEAKRIGEILGRAVEKVTPTIEFQESAQIICSSKYLHLPRRKFPFVTDAQQKLENAICRLNHLRAHNASRQLIRTAECDWFGAEESLSLAKACVDGRLEQTCRMVMPAEVQVIKLGPWAFVGWQGEIFVDYALALKERYSNAFVISMANGELQGYIVTKDAADEGGYEASNAIFSYESGMLLVDATCQLLEQT